jgi:hypothetical protein
MVFCGDLDGRFSGSKKCHFLKIFLWIFLVTAGGENLGGRREEKVG